MTDEALPFVNIIMPIRNEVDFIEQTIRSVLDNAYPDEKMEVLVVDGMSTDRTREIVGEYASREGSPGFMNNY